MRWIEQFLTLMREGLGHPISLEFLLPYTGQERLDIMKEVDAIARYHYLLKVAYEAKVRKRFGRTQGQSAADAEDEAAAELVNGVVRDLSFGELVRGDADDLAAEASDDEEEDSSEDDEEDDDDDDDSDDSGESESGSEETEDDDGSTEGRATRGTTPTPTVSRSHTIGHSPVSNRSPHHPGPKHSLDIPSPSRSRPSGPPLRNLRSTSLQGARSPIDKELPPLPLLHHHHTQPGLSRPLPGKAPPPPSKPPKKKKPEGPKPPELHHIPKLLPLFVEMVSAVTCEILGD